MLSLLGVAVRAWQVLIGPSGPAHFGEGRSAPVFVSTVADHAEEVAGARSHGFDALVILGLEREVEDTDVVGHVLGLAETDAENRARDRPPVENGARRHVRDRRAVLLRDS